MRTLLLAAALLAAAPSWAQTAYRAQADTLYYENLNPYRMWVVRGADTVGSPVRALTIERHVWADSADVLTVDLHTDRLVGEPEHKAERLVVSRAGRVLLVDGEANKERGRYDFVLRLPAAALAEGVAWVDTSRSASPVEGGDYSIGAVRQLRVERVLDSLGTRVAVVRSTGDMWYRDVYPSGPPGQYWTLDVTGPTRETFVFDLANGRLVGREWWMDLRGTAGFPAAGGRTDTVPAGLFSTDTTRMISAARARLLARPLPPGDTTLTSEPTGRPVLLHTVRRTGEVVETGTIDLDGTLTTVRAESRDGVPLSFELLRTAAWREPLRRVLTVRDGQIRMTGDRDTVLAVPAGRWTIAGDAGSEHLVALLGRAALAGADEVEVSVLHPVSLTWERVRATLRPFQDVVLAVWSVKRGGEDRLEVALVAKDGSLLFTAEDTELGEVVRTPRDESPAGKRLLPLLEALQKQITSP